MAYLGYFEVIESSGWQLADDIQTLKQQWAFTYRIFNVGNMTQQQLDNMPKPRYPKIVAKYPLVYSKGNLMHEKEIETNQSSKEFFENDSFEDYNT